MTDDAFTAADYPTAEKISEWYTTFFAPAGGYLVVAGDFDPDQARNSWQDMFYPEPQSPPDF